MRRTVLISAALAAVLALGFVGYQIFGNRDPADNDSPVIITDVAPFPIEKKDAKGLYSISLKHKVGFKGTPPSYVENSTLVFFKTHQIDSLEVASNPGH